MTRSLFLLAILIKLSLIPELSCALSSDGSKSSLPRPNLSSKADWPSPVTDTETFGFLLFDLFEYKAAPGGGSLNWDINGWRGGDVQRLWIKSEGSYASSSRSSSDADFQLLYGRLITAFFDAQVGVRFEQAWGGGKNASRQSAVIGLQGLSLYVFEIEAALFVGDSGHLASRFSASKNFLFTQRAIAQLRVETNAAAQRSSEFATGSGVNDLSLGLRFRYEIKREIAPYIGVSWTNLYGETADFRKLAGDQISEWNVVGGLRLWF